MPTMRAEIPTASASRYLQQLCKHWSHKFEVTFTPEHGVIPFDTDRRCTLDATPEALTLAIVTVDQESMTRMQNVVFEHLQRFAFREELSPPQWSEAVEAA